MKKILFALVLAAGLSQARPVIGYSKVPLRGLNSIIGFGGSGFTQDAVVVTAREYYDQDVPVLYRITLKYVYNGAETTIIQYAIPSLVEAKVEDGVTLTPRHYTVDLFFYVPTVGVEVTSVKVESLTVVDSQEIH
jgi:hypothetical protein